MDAFHHSILRKLPAEIRQAIYEEYYHNSSERVIYFTHNGRHGKCIVRVNADAGQSAQPVFDLVRPRSNLLHLPLTCRSIYEECMPILYTTVPLRFLSPDALVAFFFQTPAPYRSLITRLTLEAPGYFLLEDHFDEVQWGRAWHAIGTLRRLMRLTVNLLDSERSLDRRDWQAVLQPMVKVAAPVEFNVKLHCEPDVLPNIERTSPFSLSWLGEDGSWHNVEYVHHTTQADRVELLR